MKMLQRFALAMCVVVYENGDLLRSVSFVMYIRSSSINSSSTQKKTAVNEKIKKISIEVVCCFVCMGHNESSDVNDLMNKMRFIVVVTRMQ